MLGYPRTRRSGLAGLLVLSVVVLLGLLPLTAQAASYNGQELEFVRLLNNYRASQGLGRLLLSDTISNAATRHNLDMGRHAFFDHTSLASDYFPSGSSPWDRMRSVGYRYNTAMGENIAAGMDTAAKAFESWKTSPGHRANMLNGAFRVVGVSMELVPGSPYEFYWTTDFGGYIDPSAHEPPAAPRNGARPTCRLVRPQNGDRVSGVVSVQVEATDDVGVSRVDLYVDAQLRATDRQAPYSFSWDTTCLKDGLHFLMAISYDAAGNSSLEAIAGLGVCNSGTPPTTRPPSTTTPRPSTTATTIARTRSFSDVPPGSRHYADVTRLIRAGIMGGYKDGRFAPHDRLTRGQFAKVIMLAVGKHTEAIENQGRATFPDVPYTGDPYPFDFVEEAVRLGIIKGYPDGSFLPYGDVTRLQLTVMVVRAAAGHLRPVPAGYNEGLGDIPPHGRGAVRQARYNNLLPPEYLGNFNPYALATRGQVAEMTVNLMDALRQGS